MTICGLIFITSGIIELAVRSLLPRFGYVLGSVLAELEYPELSSDALRLRKINF